MRLGRGQSRRVGTRPTAGAHRNWMSHQRVNTADLAALPNRHPATSPHRPPPSPHAHLHHRVPQVVHGALARPLHQRQHTVHVPLQGGQEAAEMGGGMRHSKQVSTRLAAKCCPFTTGTEHAAAHRPANTTAESSSH